MTFTGFLMFCPDRVRRVIQEGPVPLKEYGSDRFNQLDKKFGLMRFKGGEGRGGISMKSGQAGVVYWDPDFMDPEYKPSDIPEEVLDKHTYEEYVSVFKSL